MWWPALTGLVALLTPLLPGCREGAGAGGGDFPRKPVKVIVPFAPGGGSDSFARIVQKAVADHDLLPQPLVVINVPGAGGTVGSRRARDAPADGHTILCLHEGIFTSKYAGRVPYGPEAFRPIAATGQSNLVICVRGDAAFRDLPQLMAAAAERPDPVLFGMAQGTPTHFAGRRLEAAGPAGARFRFVASGGGAKRFNDLVGGHIDVTPFSLAEYAVFRASGVRAIAYLGGERLPELPDVPTAREQGFDVEMTHVQYWWAPKTTPEAAVRRIADALEAALATPYVREKLAELRIEPLLLRDESLAAHLDTRDREFQDVALVRYEGLPDPVPGVLALVLLLAVFSVAQAFGTRGDTDAPAGQSAWKPLLASAGVLSLYLLLMQFARAPYAPATAAFVPLMGIAAGARSRGACLRLAVIGAALGCGGYLLFTRVLVIDLP